MPDGVHVRRPAEWVAIEPRRGWLAPADLGEAWRFRELAWLLALRDLRLRYKQTFFGVAWAVMQPLLATVLFSLLLGRVDGLPSDGLPYPVFVFAGLVAWWYVSAAVGAAAQSLVEDRALVTKVYFPRVLAPLAAVIPGLVDLGISLLIATVLLALYGVAPDLAVILLPVWIGLLVLTATAVGLWLAALNVQYRDVPHALTFATQVWFFVSPVVFATSLIDDEWRPIYALNPLVGVIDGLRWSLIGAPAPGAHVVVSLAMTAALLIGGLLYFGRVSKRFADVI